MNFQALKTPLHQLREIDQLHLIRALRADRLLVKLKKDTRRSKTRRLLKEILKLPVVQQLEIMVALNNESGGNRV